MFEVASCVNDFQFCKPPPEECGAPTMRLVCRLSLRASRLPRCGNILLENQKKYDGDKDNTQKINSSKKGTGEIKLVNHCTQNLGTNKSSDHSPLGRRKIGRQKLLSQIFSQPVCGSNEPCHCSCVRNNHGQKRDHGQVKTIALTAEHHELE